MSTPVPPTTGDGPGDTTTDPTAAHRQALELEREKSRLAEERAAADHARAVALEERKAALATEKADLDDELAHGAAAATHDREHRTLVDTAMLEVATAGIDRSRDSAKFIQTAAAALMGAYTGLLALVFSVTERQLPLRGVYAATFLAASIALAVGYLAFVLRSRDMAGYVPGPSLVETQLRRTAKFLEWTNAAVTRRAWALRASVLAFGVGVAFIPAAFVGPTSAATPTAGAPEPPAIPERVPAALAEPARRLFEHQVDAYFEALGEDGAAANRGPGRPDGMPGRAGGGSGPAVDDADDDRCRLGLVRSCGWRTEDDVERNFRLLALGGLLLIIVGATVPDLLGRRSNPNGEQGDDGGTDPPPGERPGGPGGSGGSSRQAASGSPPAVAPTPTTVPTPPAAETGQDPGAPAPA